MIVTGTSQDGSNNNYYTIKYDPDGYELWSKSSDSGYDSVFGDFAYGVATDTSGNVIVTGTSHDRNTHTLLYTFNYYTIKYGEKTGAPPKIIFYAPESPVNDIERATRTFNITVNQTVNVSWQINGTEVQTNESVTEVTYTNTSAVAGTWNVSAIVTNANGTDMHAWMWNVTLKENQPPVANFTYSPANPIVAQTITFNASNSTDPDGDITKYEWTFGDGNITNTTEQIITYSYTSAGTFTVNLTVTDDDGAINTTFQAITVSKGLVFDTSTGTYPSIAGTHNGTIELNQAIIVQKFYTYPCTGTGGHTEYAKICNESWSVETLPWAGYNGDWQSLSFPESFKLCANKTYNYEIRTSSYPQIHHTDALLTVNGRINCTEFVDVNGERYDNWIPAIILGYNVTPTPPTSGTIKITSDPSGAVIEFDGERAVGPMSITPTTITTSPGTHTIKLSQDGYQDWSTSVEVTAGGLSEVHGTLTPTPTPTPSVYISEINLADEWVKITNSGASSIKLTEWKITDEGAIHTYIFPSFTLSSGATVTLYTGKGTDTTIELYWGSGRPIWNNDGDTAKLYDASGNLIDQLKA